VGGNGGGRKGGGSVPSQNGRSGRFVGLKERLKLVASLREKKRREGVNAVIGTQIERQSTQTEGTGREEQVRFRYSLII